jgi:superfamily II DNA or RNA helicase
LIDILERHRGALLADDVGLGKTHIAAAVIQSGIDRWRPVLVVAPASILGSWRALLKWCPRVSFCSYARLSQGRVNEAERYGLVVVDEAHRLRNNSTKRYRMIGRLALTARLLLVTATPFQNCAGDVANLLRLFLPWAVPAEPESLDDLRLALAPVLVRRTRWTAEHLYGGLRNLRLAKRVSRAMVYKLPPPLESLALRLPEIARAALPEGGGSTRSLLGSLLLKRLESSPAALESTLQRCRNYLIRASDAAEHGRHLDRRRFRDLFGDAPDAQTTQILMPFFFDGFEASQPVDLDSAIETIAVAIRELSALSIGEDRKLQTLIRLLDEPRDRRTIVMTSYQDTADYLFANLEIPRIALTTGRQARTRAGRSTRSEVLRGFAPLAQGASIRSSIDVLIATDVLSEGVNLQDAERLVHYDLPWNPMALEQRAGRLDRLGAVHQQIEVITFEVADVIERQLGLERTLTTKISAQRALLESRKLGNDRDGILIGCLAGLPAASSSNRPLIGSLGAGPPGWVVAALVGGRLVVAGVTEDGMFDPYPLLASLAAGEVAEAANGEEDPVPTELLSRLVQGWRRQAELEHWLRLDPDPSQSRATAIQPLLEELCRRAGRAYVEGDTDELDRVEAAREAIASSGWAGRPDLGQVQSSKFKVERWNLAPGTWNPEPGACRVQLLGWLRTGSKIDSSPI